MGNAPEDTSPSFSHDVLPHNNPEIMKAGKKDGTSEARSPNESFLVQVVFLSQLVTVMRNTNRRGGRGCPVHEVIITGKVVPRTLELICDRNLGKWEVQVLEES